MAQDFTELFIDKSRIGLAANMLTEFGLNHPHR